MLIIAIRLIGKYVLEHATASAFHLHRPKSKRQPLHAHASLLQHEKTSDKSLCMIAMLAKKGAMKKCPLILNQGYKLQLIYVTQILH